MKNKTKIMLGLAALTAGTLAAGATGTFAWFTTNKTATATYSKVVVQATQGNLSAAIKGITDANAAGALGPTTSATSSASYMTDVSSCDGVNFAQPEWTTSSKISGGEFSKIKSVTGSKYYTQFIITVTNVGSGTQSVKVNSLVLKSMTVTAHNAKGEASGTSLINWVRVSTNILTSDTNSISAANKTTLFQNSIAGDNAKNYVVATEEPGKMEGSTIKTLEKDPTLFSATNVDINAGSIEVGSSVYIGVSVWLEGTMDDGQEVAAGESVDLEFKFGDATSSD